MAGGGPIPQRSPIGRFREGLLLFSEGAHFLRRRVGLWPLAAVPVAFALVSVGLAVTAFWLHMDGIHAVCASWLPMLEAHAWWSWIWVGPGRLLFWLVGWLTVLASFALSLIAALLLANLASAPFLDRLSQRVETIVRGGALTQVDGSTSLVGEILRSFAAELQRLAVLFGIWSMLALLGFAVPGAQLVTAPVGIGVTVLLLPLDYAGFALDRRRIAFRARRRWLRQNFATMIGFGGIAFIVCLVPGLNLLMMPVMVTAGTLLVLRTSLPEERVEPVGSI